MDSIENENASYMDHLLIRVIRQQQRVIRTREGVFSRDADALPVSRDCGRRVYLEDCITVVVDLD